MKKIIFLLLSCLMSANVLFAQRDGQPLNLPKYDLQPIHFGFILGINSANFVINRAGDFKLRDSIYSVESQSVSGLNLGIVSNIRIGNHFDFRFIPTLAFSQRNLNYVFIYNDSTLAPASKKIESSYIEFPFLLKFKSKRVDNYRVYVIAGVKFAFDMVSQAKINVLDRDIVKLNKKDYGYEVGLGFDFYLTYFKFSPEIKMFNGMANLLKRENTQYASPIDALYAKTFMVSFLFE